jgi:asparagine synthase (glutamine-hydrolysing)
MSGIAGIANFDGNHVDRELLLRMTRMLSFRGPDAQKIWTDGGIGLGHTAHLIRGNVPGSVQPESLGTGTWITADVRLDAREELVEALRRCGQHANLACSDLQLVLYAYDAWEEQCLERLLGDFSFGLWDARKRRLFCACDPLGVRQLYFAKIDSCLIFSNTLECVRMHADVSDQLNDAAIADFLLFGMNYEESTTSFADIQRLPRGHWLRWSAEGLKVLEYWRPPATGSIRYKKRGEYVEHFNELLEKAVADRVRTRNTGILLSGGIDSSSVAAVCRETGAKRGYPFEVHAFTTIDESSGDGDGPAAKMVADVLRIPLHCLNMRAIEVFGGWDTISVHWPEPVEDPLGGGVVPQFREAAQHCAVLLSGEGCDNLMNCEPGQHVVRLWQEGRLVQAALDTVEHVFARFRAPDGLRGPMRRIPRFFSPNGSGRTFPEWLNPELVKRLHLKERWSNPMSEIPCAAEAQNPGAYASLFLPQWRHMFERLDAAFTKAPVEVRYPFLDVRLVRYLLATPPLPWFFRKFLLREAMRSRLPERTRKRPKVPRRHDPLVEALRRPHTFSFLKDGLVEELERYVSRAAVESPLREPDAEAAARKIRPWCLNFWLKGMRREQPLMASTCSVVGH